MSINTISQWVGIQANQLTIITIIGYKLFNFYGISKYLRKANSAFGAFFSSRSYFDTALISTRLFCRWQFLFAVSNIIFDHVISIKVIVSCDQARFELLIAGPQLMEFRDMEAKLKQSRINNRYSSKCFDDFRG
jgi:hypothetical protein